MLANPIYDEIVTEGEDAPMPLANQIEALFSRAEPRLQRLARARQVAPDAIDDVIQETLLEAWKSLEQLRDETRFSAWLDGICRNVCLRHQRRQGILLTREAPFPPSESEPDDESESAFTSQLADPDSFDPTEELSRQDMALLLDRALGYLSAESRMAVEQHYLAEAPQRELAARMGLSLSALEARLHRARGQLLHTLSHDLRDDALALGLAILPDDVVGWRMTQITCYLCGRVRMEGIFEPMAGGRINMRLRCPACQTEEINTLGLVDLAHARSFLPATKKTVYQLGQAILDALPSGSIVMQCWICQRPVTLRVIRDSDLAPEYGMHTRLQSSCGCLTSGVFAISPYGALPQVRDFIFGTSAIIILPEMEMTYAGQRAIRFGALSPADGRRLYVFADYQTLLPLAVITE
ncbi:MAG TPA: RNA polymerase sigma factor [Ktedonobacterales bacterium]|nr:RNA polymerase sigma factor [Ktedonobacterales bacterium]